MNKFIFSIAVILTAMLGQQCSQSDIETLPPRDFLEGVDRVIYIEGNIFLDMEEEGVIRLTPEERRYSRYRKEITGARLKQLREFLLGYSSPTLRETPIEEEQIIEVSGPFCFLDGGYTKLLIPGKKGKKVTWGICFETEEEAEMFFMIVGREGRAEGMRELRLMREREERKKPR